MREVHCGRVRQNAQMYKPLTQNNQVGCLVWYLDPRIIPGTSHKLRSFWAGLYRVTKQKETDLAQIKPAYYPGEEKLVSLDVLNLYRGEDVVIQNPEKCEHSPMVTWRTQNPESCRILFRRLGPIPTGGG